MSAVRRPSASTMPNQPAEITSSIVTEGGSERTVRIAMRRTMGRYF
jgi:hypothetical protein